MAQGTTVGQEATASSSSSSLSIHPVKKSRFFPPSSSTATNAISCLKLALAAHHTGRKGSRLRKRERERRQQRPQHKYYRDVDKRPATESMRGIFFRQKFCRERGQFPIPLFLSLVGKEEEGREPRRARRTSVSRGRRPISSM